MKNFHQKNNLPKRDVDSLSFIKEEVQESVVLHYKIKELNKVVSNLLIISTISLTIFIMVIGLSIFSGALKSKDIITQKIKASFSNIEKSYNSMLLSDTNSANIFLETAEKEIETAKTELKQVKPLAIGASLLPMSPDYNQSLDSALEANMNILEISKGINKISESYNKSENIENYKETVFKEYQSIKNSVNSLKSNLYEIDERTLPEQYKSIFSFTKNNIETIEKYIISSETLIKELPELLGKWEEKNYLILFQNNRELRSTGGFIGSFGLMNFSNGTMGDIKVEDIYSLDKPYGEAVKNGLSEYIQPPLPMKAKSTGNWALRDSNLNPDFSIAKDNILNFYYEEIKYSEKKHPKELDGIIAINTSLFEDILRTIGPIYVEKYDLEINGNNTLETLQLEVEAGEDKNNNRNPKDILGFAKDEIFKKLSTSNRNTALNILLTTIKNLNEKNILVQLENLGAQNYFDNLSWSGIQKNLAEKEDYLMVVNNNFGGGKSSSEIKEDIKQKVYLNNGKLLKELTITRTHTSDYKYKYYDPWAKEFRWLIGKNNNYTKIYVPKGSKLITASGLGEKIDILEENNKTVFGTNFSLAPLEGKSLNLIYELPFNLKDTNQYKLVIQKQPGSVSSYFETNYIQSSKTNLSEKDNLLYGYLNIDRYIAN